MLYNLENLVENVCINKELLLLNHQRSVTSLVMRVCYICVCAMVKNTISYIWSTYMWLVIWYLTTSVNNVILSDA